VLEDREPEPETVSATAGKASKARNGTG
jgi:hypothetical protein